MPKVKMPEMSDIPNCLHPTLVFSPYLEYACIECGELFVMLHIAPIVRDVVNRLTPSVFPLQGVEAEISESIPLQAVRNLAQELKESMNKLKPGELEILRDVVRCLRREEKPSFMQYFSLQTIHRRLFPEKDKVFYRGRKRRKPK